MSKILSSITAFLLGLSILQLSLVQKSGSIKMRSANLNLGTIIVPDNYTTIQEAVDAANLGDTIYARARHFFRKFD